MQALTSPPDLHLMRSPRRGHDASGVENCLCNHHLSPEVLGQAFQPAGRVDSVPDGGEPFGLAVTQFTHDGRPDVKANADPQGGGQLGSHDRIEICQALPDTLRRLQSVAGTNESPGGDFGAKLAPRAFIACP